MFITFNITYVLSSLFPVSDIVSHSMFITFNIISIRFYFPFDITSYSAFITFQLVSFVFISLSTLCPIPHSLLRPSVLSSLFPILCYVRSTFCPIWRIFCCPLSQRKFCPSTFFLPSTFFTWTFCRRIGVGIGGFHNISYDLWHCQKMDL